MINQEEVIKFFKSGNINENPSLLFDYWKNNVDHEFKYPSKCYIYGNPNITIKLFKEIKNSIIGMDLDCLLTYIHRTNFKLIRYILQNEKLNENQLLKITDRIQFVYKSYESKKIYNDEDSLAILQILVANSNYQNHNIKHINEKLILSILENNHLQPKAYEKLKTIGVILNDYLECVNLDNIKLINHILKDEYPITDTDKPLNKDQKNLNTNNSLTPFLSKLIDHLLLTFSSKYKCDYQYKNDYKNIFKTILSINSDLLIDKIFSENEYINTFLNEDKFELNIKSMLLNSQYKDFASIKLIVDYIESSKKELVVDKANEYETLILNHLDIVLNELKSNTYKSNKKWISEYILNNPICNNIDEENMKKYNEIVNVFNFKSLNNKEKSKRNY